MPDKDLLKFLLGIPVILVYLDAQQKVLSWRFSSLADTVLMLRPRDGGVNHG
jgi:hypothetical protein